MLNLQFILFYLRYMWGGNWLVENVVWREGDGWKRQNTVI